MRRDDVRRLALEYLSALGGDVPDDVAALVTDDFVNEHQVTIADGCVGRDAYRERLPAFFADFSPRRYQIVDLAIDAAGSDHSGHGIAVVRYRFRAGVAADDGTGDRIEIDVPGVMWIEVRDGLVARRIDTWDALHYFHQTGITPPGGPAG